jgi:hypothetical protein
MPSVEKIQIQLKRSKINGVHAVSPPRATDPAAYSLPEPILSCQQSDERAFYGGEGRG